jgi:hypothetical protein
MNSSNSPRTDAHVAMPHQIQHDYQVVPADFARTLERELTEAKRDINNQERVADAWYKEMHGPGGYREREDSLRTLLATAEKELLDTRNALEIATRSADEQMRYKREAEKERDEAVRNLDRYLESAVRNMGGKTFPKHHLIDEIAKTIQHHYERSERLAEAEARLTPSASQSAEMEKSADECPTSTISMKRRGARMSATHGS